MRFLQIVLVIFTISSFYNCDKGLPENNYPEITLPITDPVGDEAYLTGNSDYIFDQNSLRTFRLELSGSALQQINEDPSAEQYVEGMLIFEEDTISPVGIRYKGSIGGFVNCLSGNSWSNPTGYKTCSKLSMKIKINWDGREERFYGLKKLQFHSMNLDESMMRDRLGYHLFREMGVPAPRAVHARLLINGDFAGLFALVEQIDSRFIKYNFDDDDGNLYKEIWPLDSNGEVQSEVDFRGGLKTNEKDNPSFELIRSFGSAMETAIESQIPLIQEDMMNMEETMAMVVVDRTIRHDDGPFHWYCSGNSCSPHNFYWYEEPNNKKLHVIPWDLDNAFENIIKDENAVTPVADAFGEISNNCEPFKHGNWNLTQLSASCDRIIAGWASFESLYNQQKMNLIEGAMSKQETDVLLDTWYEQIKNSVIEENENFDDAVSINDWEEAITKMKERLEFARTH